MRFSLRIGVSPTNWVMSSATCRRERSIVVFCTLQGTEPARVRQSHQSTQTCVAVGRVGEKKVILSGVAAVHRAAVTKSKDPGCRATRRHKGILIALTCIDWKNPQQQQSPTRSLVVLRLPCRRLATATQPRMTRFRGKKRNLLRRVLLPGIIPAAGADYQLAISLGLGFDADGAIAACSFRGRRLVSDGVLVSDVVRHAAADRVDFV